MVQVEPSLRDSDALVVDRDSKGGRCSDETSASLVSEVAPWCSLDRALEAAPEGSVVLVREGEYPPAQVQGLKRSERVTFKPFPGERVILGGLTIQEASNLRFEGFTMRGRTSITFGSKIELVKNDYSPQGVTVRPSDDVLIERNRFHNLTYDGMKAGAGYAVALIGGWSDPDRPQRVSNVTIRDNSFSYIPADAIQVGTVEDLLIEGNEFDHVTPFLDDSEHSDGIQMLGTADRVTIRRNYFHDQPRALIAKRAVFNDLVIEDNLMVRLSGIALNIYDAPGVRIVNNTIWDTLLGIRLQDLPEVPAVMRGAVVVRNIVDSFGIGPSKLATEDHNLIGKRDPDTRYGPNDRFGTSEAALEEARRAGIGSSDGRSY